MFSRMGRFPYRSSRDALNKGSISGSYGVRLVGLAEISSANGNGNGFAACENSALGLLRSYLTSVGAGKQIAKLHHLKELDSTFANLRLRRLFCNQALEKKESGADEQSNTTEPKKGKIDTSRDLFIWFSLICFALWPACLIYLMPKQISFQEFKEELLEPGLVDHIVVSNKSVANVCVRSSPPNDNQTNAGDSNGRRFLHSLGFYFYIGSVKSFEEELEKAQKSLGVEPHHYVPVTYDSEMMSDDHRFRDELLKIMCPFVIGAQLWSEFLNIGKAQIMQLGFFSIVVVVTFLVLFQNRH